MKKLLIIALGLCTVCATPGWSQPPGARIPGPSGPVSRSPDQLSKFNLDFPGGNAKELVSAIEKATGKPLNAIVGSEALPIKLPPLKMNNVDVDQLFHALQSASQEAQTYRMNYIGGGQYQQITTGYGFRTEGQVTDDSIWYFYVIKAPQIAQPPEKKSCRFYPLEFYLDKGLTVDDITTAIQTAWKMLGQGETPELSFHNDTKLLIAVGDPEKLQTIDSALQALGTQTYTSRNAGTNSSKAK